MNPTPPRRRLPAWVHRLAAAAFGYFWLPCPRCGRYIAGYEIGDGTICRDGRTYACCRFCSPTAPYTVSLPCPPSSRETL